MIGRVAPDEGKANGRRLSNSSEPAMRVVELRHQSHLLNASPNNLDGHALQMRGGEGNQINDEDEVW